MMTTIVSVTCDRCGKSWIRTKDGSTIGPMPAAYKFDVHKPNCGSRLIEGLLCQECSQKLWEWIKSGSD